ncbi:hypothetical protein GGU10DRAFT_367355 [Lentinula aff. detonsa]|uniref:Uncharacterized protein n=1 Tax=Lentinula aff. detonsa TaxID=2804958 RepID=A0AA38KL71_9AGAR|nr:hypothetical protein GGU10DRAFT_367355 [Lentinula aff. detonsa]
MHLNPSTVHTSTSTVVLLVILSLFFTNYTHAIPLSPIPIPPPLPTVSTPGSIPISSNSVHTPNTHTLTIRNEPEPEIVHIKFHDSTDPSQSQSQSQSLTLPDLPQHTNRDPSWFLRALTQVILYTFTHIPNQDLGSPHSSIQFLHPGPSPGAVPDLGVGFELPFNEETYPWYSFSFETSHRGCLPNGCTGRILYVSPRQKDRIEVVVNDGNGREVLHVRPNQLVRFNNEGRLVY